MRRVTGIAAGVVVAATGLLTAGCLQGGASAAGGSTTGAASGSATSTATPADEQAVAAAYGKTIAAGSARIATTTAIGLGNLSAPLNATGTISFTSGSVDLTEALRGGNGASAETRFVDNVLYERLPSGLAGQLAKGKPWISLQVAKLNQQGNGGALKQLFTDSPTDPSTVLGFLRGVGSNVTNLGPATIDGAPATHYQLTLNLDTAAAGANQATVQGIRVLEHELGTNQLPAQIWLDQAGRLLRISVREALVGPSSGSATPAPSVSTQPTSTQPTSTSQPSGAISFSFVATFSDFGMPATIAAPPATQVADLTSELGGQ